ncbi:hypothetical protein L1987_37320 [Smallanthus sonchifolius]|uniref:Uncharacterized protein n=1 Tax=Smallanthus sonchifolius TaxID=185202 RepID=A0ACB9HGG0_9ASTR|nr:hypothetical protein L1987_37320 [Smallanthus sonchifolius]
MDLLFVKRHNVCAFLDANDPKSAEFVPVLNFLANSNISFAISHNLPRYFVHIFIHFLSIRKGGFDSANAMVAYAVLGLIKGRNNNFSRLVFTQLKENLTGAVKGKFLVYPRFHQIIIKHLHPNLQQGGNSLVFYHMGAKSLSYMKSKNKRTNRAIVDIPLFSHVISEEEEFVPDIDPDIPVEEDDELAKEEEVEVEQDEGNQQEAEDEADIEIPVIQEKEQLADEPVLEAAFVDEVQIPVEPMINVEAEPKEKKIKTGFEDLSCSSDSIFDTPQPTSSPSPQPTPQPIPHPSPQQAPIPTPPPSPQHVHIPTPPTSPSHEPTSSVPRVKTLSLEVKKLQDHVKEKETVIEGLRTELNECKEEVKDLKLEVWGLHTQLEVQQTQLETQQKLISKQHEEFKALAEIVEQLKASLIKLEAVEVKIEEQELDLPSTSERREARKRGKGTDTEVETMILDEKDVASGDELNALLDEIDNFGYNDLYPEILPTEELETERPLNLQLNLLLILTTQTRSGLPLKRPPVDWKYDPEKMNPGKTKKRISKTRFHLKTKKPYVFLSVVIECEGKEDMVIFEPMELLKFQPGDLEVLFKNHIQAYSDEDERMPRHINGL